MKPIKQQTLFLPKNHVFASNELVRKLLQHLNFHIEQYDNLHKLSLLSKKRKLHGIICTDEKKTLELEELYRSESLKVKSSDKTLQSLEQMACSLLVFPQPKNSQFFKLMDYINHNQEEGSSFFIYEPSSAGELLNKVKPTHIFIGDLSNIETKELPQIKTVLKQSTESVVFNWDQELSRNLSKTVPSKRISYGSLVGCDVRVYQQKESVKLLEVDLLIGKNQRTFCFDKLKINKSDILAYLAVCFANKNDPDKSLENIANYLNAL